MLFIKDKEFEGERPLFSSNDLEMENVIIHFGESALKHCNNVKATRCRFEGKYPFWHNCDFEINDCFFTEGVRAAIWYSKKMRMFNSTIEAPKMFRDMCDILIENSHFSNAQETLWHCEKINLKNVKFNKADYIFMQSADIRAENLEINGNYSFQYCKNIEIKNSVINSKDAFWNTENVTIYNSTIDGEYLGWHSKNLTLINCKIAGSQSLCYAQNLVMKNCEMAEDANLSFEYSTLDAEIKGSITSVKNPNGGSISADFIGELIFDKYCKNPKACKITSNIGKSSIYEI